MTQEDMTQEEMKAKIIELINDPRVHINNIRIDPMDLMLDQEAFSELNIRAFVDTSKMGIEEYLNKFSINIVY